MTATHKILPSIALLLTGLIPETDAATLSTTFASTEISGGNWTNIFNVGVINPLGIQFTDFTVNVAQASAPFTLNIYVRPTTYVGSETTTTGWTLVSTGTALTGANSGPVTIDVPDFILPQGTFGMALVNSTYQMQYTTGATDYSNADLLIDNGVTVTGPLSGSVLANRTWNGTITYNVIPEPSTLGFVAIGALALRRRGRSRH